MMSIKTLSVGAVLSILISCFEAPEPPKRIRTPAEAGDAIPGGQIPPGESPTPNPIPSSTGTPTPTPTAAPANSNVPGATVYRFSGSYSEMGRQQGAQFKTDINFLLANWLEPKLSTFGTLGRSVAASMSAAMAKELSLDQKSEVDAVAAASGVDATNVMIANNAADIMQLVAAQNFFGCSSFIVAPARSGTQGMLVGRNLDYDDSAVLRAAWKPVVFARTGKLKVFSVHVPGLSTVLTGLNEKGVFLAIKVSDGNTTRYGTPSGFIFRSILESATTAKEALDLYRKQKRTVALNITISDSNEAFELEIDSKKDAVRTFNAGGTLYGANHFEVATMGGSAQGRDDRWAKLASLDARPGQISMADVKSVIGSAGGFASDPSTNVLAVFVDYKARQIIFGSDPKGFGTSAAGELHTFNFDEIFR